MGNEATQGKVGGGAEGKSMGDSLEHLPVIKNKYQPLKIIGYGAFGYVLKVIDITDSQLYAMKFFSLEIKETYLTKEEQKDMISSGIKELELLKQFKETRNIITFQESFIINRSPLNDTQGAHLCLIIEFCNGGNLNTLISKFEKQKKIIPRRYVLKWFLNLLRTLKVLHNTYKIIHRDLKPDNLLFKLKGDLESDLGEQFLLSDILNIKICDFGVGKSIKQGDFGQQIKGHLFYAPPEVLKPVLSKDVMKSKGYDSRCDIYSFGIIFFQMYKCVSQDRYEKIILEFENKKKGKIGNPKKSNIAKDVHDTRINYYELMIRAHRHGYIRDLIDQNIDDDGVKDILLRMLGPYEKRYLADQLLKTSVVRTWIHIMFQTKQQLSNPDFLGVMTCLKMHDVRIFEKCIGLLKLFVPRKVKYTKFVEKGGVKALLSTLGALNESYQDKFFMGYIFPMIIKILRTIKKNFEFSRKLTVYFRKFKLVKLLKKLIVKEDNIDLYFLVILLMKRSQSIIFYFFDTSIDLISRINQKNAVYILKLIEFMIPFLKKDEVLSFLKHYNDFEIFLFRKLPCKNDRAVNENIFKRIFENLKGYIQRNKVDKIVEMFELMMYFTYDFNSYINQKRSKLKLQFSCQPSPKCGLGFILPEQQNKNLIINPKLSTRFFYYKGGDAKGDYVELLSTEPIAKLNFSSGEEMAVGFFEFFVKNAAFNDDLCFGLQDAQDQEVVVNCRQGMCEYGNNKKIKFSPIYCFTNMMVGVGVTNHGRVFITYNNDIVTMFEAFDRNRDKDNFLFALFKIKRGNENLKGYVNFGKRNFMFTFTNLHKPGKMLIVNSLNEIKEKRPFLTQIKGKFGVKSKRISKLCDSLLNYRSFNFESEKDLMERYKQVSIRNICQTFKITIEK